MYMLIRKVMTVYTGLLAISNETFGINMEVKAIRA